jgi:hypothetical protein
MATYYASLQNGGIRFGKALHVNVATTTLRPGMLVAQDTSGSNTSGSVTVSLAGTTGDVLGIAYGGRNLTYRPTTQVFNGNDMITAIQGSGIMLLSSDFFTGGSLPGNLPQVLYSGANGLWSTGPGSNKVGKALEIQQVVAATAGVGTTLPVAVVQFNIQP